MFTLTFGFGVPRGGTGGATTTVYYENHTLEEPLEEELVLNESGELTLDESESLSIDTTEEDLELPDA